MYYCQDANMYEKVTSVISLNCPVPFSFSCHDNCKNNYVYLQYMYITPWHEYVKLSHLTHPDFCEHNIFPLLITSVINISIINLHFHYDYG